MKYTEEDVMREETDCMWDKAIISLILALITAISFYYSIHRRSTSFIILGVITYAFYFWDVITSNTYKFLNHIFTPSQAQEFLSDLSKQPPHIFWKINSYHSGHHLSSSPIVTFNISTPIKSQNDAFYNVGNSNETFDSIRLRHESAADIQSVKYANWRDLSNTSIYIESMPKLAPCRFYLIKQFYFEDDESQLKYQSDLDFFKGKKDKDTVVILIETLKLKNYTSKFIVASKANALLSRHSYILLSIMGLSWITRLYLYTQIKRSCVSISKIINY